MRDPNVPESLEGWWILHRMFAFDRRTWDGLPEKRRAKYASHASDLFEHLQSGKDGDVGLAQIVGHKGDLMLTHYARTFDGLTYAQTLVDKLEVREHLQPLGSYVSVLELGMYDATGKIHAELSARGLSRANARVDRRFRRTDPQTGRESVRRPAFVGEDPAPPLCVFLSDEQEA